MGRICKRGRFKPGMKEWVGDGMPINSKYDCWQDMTASARNVLAVDGTAATTRGETRRTRYIPR